MYQAGLNYNLEVLHLLLVKLLFYNFFEKILYLLLDLNYLLGNLEIVDETIQAPKRNLIDLLRSKSFSCLFN